MSLPARLGRLTQVERLGVGGFASVWLYRDDELQSDVAVKALADNWAQRLDIRDRFLEEARILRRADSDYVVRVYDLGEVEGTPYFVMSYADQGTLANLIERKGRLPLDRTLSVVAQAGAGLSVLHGQGTIHRDVKPANLLLRTDGSGTRVMVADLGVAKAMMHASGLTHVVGTPAYMAPEQATGGGVDARADVYALAAVTYHLLTGQVAHDGTIADLAHLEPPTPPSELADVPDGIDGVVLRGLDPDREERWPDVQTFVRAFQSLAPERGSTVLVSPPDYRRRTDDDEAPAGSRVLLLLVCLAAFVACFVGALVATQQLT
ncbi:MAG TPA: serine/threonine-protein kinase [Nocardioides sp.]|nr:serine/threonine-protein kinase [Nocardioides sp.]